MLSLDGISVIGVTLRYDHLDNFWFRLLHELAHVANHLSCSHVLIVNDLVLRGQQAWDDQSEEEAHRTAGEALFLTNCGLSE
jgi:HTH-type transcriptional regulator/antitoxin HigA